MNDDDALTRLYCGDYPAPCNCDDPVTHDGAVPQPTSMFRPGLATLFMSAEEIDAVAVAMARGVLRDHDIEPPTAAEAARVIWAHHEAIGQPICSMATMFAEARDGIG